MRGVGGVGLLDQRVPGRRNGARRVLAVWKQPPRYVDRQTFGRIDQDNLTDDIKNAVCAVVEAIQANAKGGGLSSESIGEYSVSYVSGISKAPTEGQRMKDALRMYLGDSGLLYRGCCDAD